MEEMSKVYREKGEKLYLPEADLSTSMNFSDQKPEELINALLIDIANFSKRIFADLPSARNDFSTWFSLPHPSGNGSMATSKIASSIVDELVERALAMRNLEGRIKRSNLKKDIGKGFVERFINERRDIDRRQADRLLSWAAKRAEGRCGQFRFYFPVRFTFQEEPGEIDLGPVKLKWLDKFRAENFGLAKAYLSEKADEKSRAWSSDHLRRAIEYYRSYKWFSEVTVDGFDEETAEDAAYEVLTSALDCLYFLMGRKGTYRVEVGRLKSRTMIALSYGRSPMTLWWSGYLLAAWMSWVSRMGGPRNLNAKM
tara:strand:- start:84 stop:1019 length:936 start_codon:yes stop_codon:yes gene_type:complete